MKMNARGSSRYFVSEERTETVGKSTFQKTVKRAKKPTYTYKSGSTYEGEWKGGFRDGYGIQNWLDGAYYEGEWSMGYAHGDGRFRHNDGDEYEGEWANDKASGAGTYTHLNGAKYEGNWKDDL